MKRPLVIDLFAGRFGWSRGFVATGSRNLEQLNALFNACFRIQLEASQAAGRRIPMVVENVKGAQPWAGRAQANFGSFYLWGDIASVGGRITSTSPRFGQTIRAARQRRKKPASSKAATPVKRPPR